MSNDQKLEKLELYFFIFLSFCLLVCVLKLLWLFEETVLYFY